MQIERRIIEANLPTKGFVKEDTHRKYFYHEHHGKRTGAYTYTSHGSSYRVYGNSLLKMMKKQLRLDTIGQVVDLFKCPITGKDFNQILKEKGIIK
jgi:hypothetical protein